MASQSGNMTGPFWHAASEQHYWYDVDHDLLVFQDGRRMPRPDNVPRRSLLAPSHPSFQYQYTGSPPGENSGYIPSGTLAARPRNETAGVTSTEWPTMRQRGQSNTSAVLSAQGRDQGGQRVAAATSAMDSLSLRSAPPTQIDNQSSARYPPTSQQQLSGYQNVASASGQVGTARIGGSGLSQQNDPRNLPQQTTNQPLHFSYNNVDTTLSGTPGRQVVEAVDRQNFVRTRYQTGPQQMIADAKLAQQGIPSYRLLLGTTSEGNTETLFSTFRVRDHPRRFFTVGKVFMVLWVEPAGESKTIVTKREPGTSTGRFGEAVYSKVRRFVVIREGATYCSALPIATYGAQGVGKPGVTKSEHAIIYTGKKAPLKLETEEPVRGELGMRPEPIRVDPDDKEEKLDPRSRIDFGKVTTVQHNIKVRSYGKVNDKSMSALQHQFSNVWAPTTSSIINSVHPAASGSSKANAVSHAPPALRQESVANEHHSQHTRGSGSSRTGKKVTSGSKASAKQDSDNDGDPEDRAKREAVARQHRRQLQFWAWVDELEEKGYTRENAIKEISRRLRPAQKDEDNDDDDNDSDDDEDDGGGDDDESDDSQ